MKRRDFVTLLGGAALTPFAARAQQAMPVIGFVNPTSPTGYPPAIAAFHRGLGESGYVEGRNVAIEYRWAEGRYDRLPELVADLVRRQVAVIAATGGDTPPLAAKAATSTIPIVFNSGGDPVKVGLVASLSRPGGNLTGVSRMNTELLPKRLELLMAVVPNATVVAFLVNPNAVGGEVRMKEPEAEVRKLGRQVQVLRASNEGEIEAAFKIMTQLGVRGLLIANDTFFNTRSAQLGALSLRHAIPTIYQNREFAEAGGLLSYGASLADAFRIAAPIRDGFSKARSRPTFRCSSRARSTSSSISRPRSRLA
jgi:putative tryptophan/tyrosine transport system substrate-binding protein